MTMVDIRARGVEYAGSRLLGAPVTQLTRTMAHMEGVFANAAAWRSRGPDEVLYTVDTYAPVTAGTEGGLLFGITHIHPGAVGDEFFLTKGHLHTIGNRAEFYWGIAGHGHLVLRSAGGEAWVEVVSPGSLHYIPGHTAHRLVNSGSTILDVGACWPADSGHQYGILESGGFGIRILRGPSGPRVTRE